MTPPDDDDDSPEGDTPEEAFALLGNEVRAGILHALGEARGQEGGRPVVPFSELRQRSAVDVPSSQFNYHLQQLVGRFVERTDGGYRMRPEGTELYRTIRAGTFTRQSSLEAFDVGTDCYFCGATVEADYDDGLFAIECSGCDHRYVLTMAPPSSVNTDDRAELLERIDEYNRHTFMAFARGVCPTCVNGLDTQFLPGDEVPIPGGERHDMFVHQSCGYCGAQNYLTLGIALLPDPDLVAFCRERGLDVTTMPIWELAFAMTDRYATVRSTNPWEAALSITLEGDTLELVVDGDLNVVERNRP